MKFFYKLLSKKREDVLKRITNIHNTKIDSDEGPLAIEMLEHSKLSDINRALERIKAGHFGVCVECGVGISKKRLKALPHTYTCIWCATD